MDLLTGIAVTGCVRCPHCKLINDDFARRCDCGYNFSRGTVTELGAGGVERPKDPGSWEIGIAVGFIGGLVGLAVVHTVSNAENTRKGATYGALAQLLLGLAFLGLGLLAQ